MNALETVMRAVETAARIAEHINKNISSSLQYWSNFQCGGASGIICCKSGHLTLFLTKPVFIQQEFEVLKKNLSDYNLALTPQQLNINSKDAVSITSTPTSGYRSYLNTQLGAASAKCHAFKLLKELLPSHSKELGMTGESISGLSKDVWLLLDNTRNNGKAWQKMSANLLATMIEIKIPVAEMWFFKNARIAKRRNKIIEICERVSRPLHAVSPSWA